MSIRVANLKRPLNIKSDEVAFYVGRPGFKIPAGITPLYILQNQWHITNTRNRHTVCMMFKTWLNECLDENVSNVIDALNIIIDAHRTKNVVLICWCAPLECHADTIRATVLRLAGLDTTAIESIEEERLFKQGLPDEAIESELERLIENEKSEEGINQLC